MRESQGERFCRCIKKVRMKRPVGMAKDTAESAAIGICVRSVLQRRGRTLRKFTCRGRRPKVLTQKLLKNAAK